jgi:Permuted papain-like amidase enzyme, YaeF/YiiX, C92 family
VQIDRRAAHKLIGGALLGLGWITSSQGQDGGPPLPNPTTFQSGDLVWPKKPGAFVPYKYALNTSAELDAANWYAERGAFLARLSRDPKYFTAQDMAEFKSLDFREFYARYVGDQKPGIPGAYSTGGGIYVGHVGVIEVDESNVPWVIEALLANGVVRSRYDQWIAARPGEIVWQGRIRELPLGDRTRIASEAKRYLSRPYDFWNFDLNDDAGFYCSKLVWLSVWRSLQFPVDGNSDPRRKFWFSPKQLLYAHLIIRLHDPGSYANGWPGAGRAR